MNRLENEKSAYLLQHKDNPVHWYPYGAEALQEAQKSGKPIFLSIGYSSCHWCHVMAHESFEDQATADYLNENFICIKLDREEYPDLDSYYQKACQLYTRNGGWPLSTFCLPDMRPFFVGTYFPKERSEGVSSFMDVLQELKRAQTEDPKTVEENASNAAKAVLEDNIPDKAEYTGHFPHPVAVIDALKEFQDNANGGYSGAPKFPQFAFYEWGLEQILEGVVPQDKGSHFVQTLEKMLMGGLYDHAGGGLHRYSTDEKWLVPHFEKMLYDQAGLLKTLAKLSVIYPTPLVLDAMNDSLDYLKSEMMADEKYFFAAQDADSEGAEGIYFTFTQSEFLHVLENLDDDIKTQKDKWLDYFQISEAGNFDNALNIVSLKAQEREELYKKENWDQVKKIRAALLEARKERIPPMTDTKGIASWNFMLISALTDVFQYCRYQPIKQKASDLITETLASIFKTFVVTNPDVKDAVCLRHTTTKKHSLPYLEDYVFFTEANLRVYEISANNDFLKNCLDTYSFIEREFLDNDALLTRAKSATDIVPYPNMQDLAFDSSYRSAISTMLGLVRRLSVLAPELVDLKKWEGLREKITKECLANPLGSGEALRHLTYPAEVYRVCKVPRPWAKEGKFIEFSAHLPMRFVFKYEDSDEWQICSHNECQKKGKGIEDFINTLAPKKKEGHDS